MAWVDVRQGAVLEPRKGGAMHGHKIGLKGALAPVRRAAASVPLEPQLG